MGTTKRVLGAAAIAVLFNVCGGAATAQSFMPTGGLSSQPIGHYQFCQSAPSECISMGASQPVELTRTLWTAIIDVNNLVNTMITPRTDAELWGVEENWSYPVNGFGDCEDYVLESAAG